MVQKIDRDHRRFRQIVRGSIKKHLRKYMSKNDFIGRQGKYLVSIPVPEISIPRFRYGNNEGSGVGQGDGEVGSPIGQGDPGEGKSGAGDQPGQHVLEVEVTLEELARILGEGLELPNIKPKGKSLILADRHTYTGIAKAGPESLRHFKRTFKEALKRQISLGLYDPDNPFIVPIREDKRYRTWRKKEVPHNNAVIIYMMDVSGSMGDEQKELVRLEAFWIDTWLRFQYKKLDIRYIVHDVDATEVSQQEFYNVKESGGTKISSALALCEQLIETEYNPYLWNIYPFYFSDGDNWGTEDSKKCAALLSEKLLPQVNLFCYGQVKSAYGSGQFKTELEEAFPDDQKLVISEINDKDSIYDSIKDFLGTGR